MLFVMCKGLKKMFCRFCKSAKRSVHNQGVVDRLLRSLYEREESKISRFKIKNAPKASVKYPMLFLMKKYLEISKEFLKTHCVFRKNML